MDFIDMRVIVVNAYSDKGGASRAAMRLADSLKLVGLDVEYWSIYEKHPGFLSKLVYIVRAGLNRLPAYLVSRNRVMFSSAGVCNRRLVRCINNSGADVVHLHWVNAGGMAISDLKKIRIPIVWTMHDMWAFTGGCHYDEGCGRYKNGCGLCPQLNSKSASDLSALVLNQKARTYSEVGDMTVVGLSRWMHECAKQSFLMSRFNVVNVPNPIDVNLFRPLGKQAVRRALGLPAEGILVAFGAVSSADDYRKGFKELHDALALLDPRHGVELLIFGSRSGVGVDFWNCRVHYMGPISDDEELIRVYNAADITLVPSRQENLSNTVLESLSCGTPVVAFNVGGNSDMIKHRKTGYLAEPFDVEDFASGIHWIICAGETARLAENARKTVVSTYAMMPVANRYVDLYRKLIEHPAD